jgi:hypothetical protein
MAVQIKLGTDIIWGTSSAGSGLSAYGKVLSATSKSGGEVFEQKDENGETYSVVFFDDTEEITVEVLSKTAATKPARGTSLSIAGVTGALVIDSEDKWSAGATKKIGITLKKWTS